MNYDRERESSSSALLVVFAICVAVLLGGLVSVGGGAWFFMMTQNARVHEELARSQAVEARARAERNHMLAERALAAKATVSEDNEPELLVEVDERGLFCNSRPITLGDLARELDSDDLASPRTPSQLHIHVKAKCPFEKLLGVLRFCHERNVTVTIVHKQTAVAAP